MKLLSQASLKGQLSMAVIDLKMLSLVLCTCHMDVQGHTYALRKPACVCLYGEPHSIQKLEADLHQYPLTKPIYSRTPKKNQLFQASFCWVRVFVA